MSHRQRRLPLANRAISSELRPTKSILHCWVKHLLMGDAILHGLRRRGFSAAKPVSNSAEEWLKEVVAASAVIRSDSTFLPDFQG